MVSTKQKMHIGIMGAGAIGGYVGGRLAANDATEVTLIGRRALVDAVARHGLTLREFDHDEQNRRLDGSRREKTRTPSRLVTSCSAA